MTLILSLLLACGSPEPAAPPAHDHAAMMKEEAAKAADPHAGHDMHAGHGPLPAAEPVTGSSIYQLPVTLTDTTGAPGALGVWSGHPVVVSMIYTSCTAACPLIVSDMKGVDAALSPAAREQVRYLLVSMDPARDTPSALAELRTKHNLDERWAVLGSNEDGVRQIAAVLGIRYRPLPDGGFNHSAVLTLLDPKGEIVERIDGLGQPHEALVTKAESLAAVEAVAGGAK